MKEIFSADTVTKKNIKYVFFSEKISVISCYQLLSVVIMVCYQLLSVVISCYHSLLSVVIM